MLAFTGCDDGLIDRQHALNDDFVANATLGQGFYNRYCASCHGMDAKGRHGIGSPDIRGHDAASIQSAIQRVGIMNGLSTQLTQEQMAHIAAWLHSQSQSFEAKSRKTTPFSSQHQATSCAMHCH